MTTSSATKDTILDFNLSPADIERGTDALIEQGKRAQDGGAAQNNPTFANVIIPLATYENEGTDKDIRDASMAAEEKLDEVDTPPSLRHLRSESLMCEDMYKVVRAVFDNRVEVASLGPEDRRLVEKMELVFCRHGLALDKEKREYLGTIRMRLSELAIKFSRNINEGDGRALLTRDELEGLPSDFFEGRTTEVVDGQEGSAVMTKYPDIIPVMKMAKREETRERMFVVEGQRCPENIPILQEAVALRLEAAQLLGYKTHAEFVLEENMAKAPVPVLEFEEDLRSRLNVLADTEIEEIEAFKKADKQAAGKPYAGLFGWDYRYYSNLVKECKHNINDEEVKQYFPVKEVTRSILDIYQNMLSLRFVKIDNPSMWNADVEMYEVWEATEETFVGHFYLDLFLHEGKYNHAAV
ncbi:metalloendopeptidase [Coemansia sp. S3946]|nr:metalloendopeptidase [Coemansia sp. S3946]